MNREVALNSGETVDADIVVLGVGVVPNTEFLASSSIPRDERGYIPVNEVSVDQPVFLTYEGLGNFLGKDDH